MTVASILAVLLALPQCWEDRDWAGKRRQLETIAAAIHATAETPRDAAELVSVAYHESRLCRRVHSGEHRGRGRGLWQLEGKERSYPGPFVGLGQAETDNAARVALDVLRRSRHCGRRPEDVFTAYAGRRCGTSWPTLESRARVYRWAVRRVAQ